MHQFNSNLHVTYPDVYRYWSPGCEAYAGGDCLLSVLREDWEVIAVYREDHWLSGARLVVVMHFDLRKGDDTMHMPVVANPFIRRFIYQESVPVKPISERKMLRQRDLDAVGD
jgi:hypothetical protein